ncbi:MAG TPA: LLM class flavin-dependent oxidoreductase [Pseudogracilibacillus sp.]|nr:LLM class flavin-dependent oxidoreductase [Pseudogracilibacillus sp.]
MTHLNIPVSALNLVPIRKGTDAKQAVEDMVELAQALDKFGYNRYWIAEHHNTTSLVSSATVILMKHVLEHTEQIRVGSGGIMLPNHAPLVVAEQFGTMATIYPDRLDLGLGRAPGTDMMTADALRRSSHDAVFQFPKDIEDLLTYFGPEEKQHFVRAFPGVGTEVPLYILGSSPNSAQLAARLGLPYVFAAHFAPKFLEEALTIYREEFQPSAYLDKPYVMVGLNVIAQDTDEEAFFEATTMQQFFLNIVRGSHDTLQPPVDDMSSLWTPSEEQAANSMFRVSLIGSKDKVREDLRAFQEKFAVDEIIAIAYMYDQEKQKRSYEILKEITSE